MNKLFNRVALFAIVTVLTSHTAQAGFSGPVNLGAAGGFAALALTGNIDDSGPLTNPFTINGDVGVATSGKKFSASGSVSYNAHVFLHSGVTYNSSASNVPQPTTGASVDTLLDQAKTDAFNASAAALALGQNPTATYGTINNDFSITEANPGNYVFNLTGVNFSGGKVLTLSAPAGSSFVLNISTTFKLTFGSILLAGGLSPNDVLYNYTGTSDAAFSGGGNVSRVEGILLAPNATIGLHPGAIIGEAIGASVTMSSGAQIVVPEAPVTSLLIFGGLIATGVAMRRRRRRAI
jgi:hypothetical protein